MDGQTTGGVGGQSLERCHVRWEAARQHGLTVAEVDEWREKFLLGAENAFHSRPRDEEAVRDDQIKKRKIGDLVLATIFYGRCCSPILLTARHPMRESGAVRGLGTTELSDMVRVSTYRNSIRAWLR